MSRKPIQVPVELKEKIEALKSNFRAKTEYEVIEHLVSYYEKSSNHLYVEKDGVMEFYQSVKSGLKLRSDTDFLRFLLEHYAQSDIVKKELLDLYVQMRGNGWYG